MLEIIDEWDFNGYKILTLNENTPNINYRKYLINDEVYDPVTVYDMGNCVVAIKDPGKSLKGGLIEFI